MQLDLNAVDPNVRDMPTRRNNFLASLKRGRNTHGRIDSSSARQLQYGLRRLAVRAVDRCGRAEAFRCCEPVVIEVDDDDFGWRIELSRQ